MNKEHETEIIMTLTPYLLAFPNSKLNEGGLLVYSRALSSLSLAEIEAAMLKLMRTCKFFPSVAEIFDAAKNIKRYAENDETLTAEEAWGEVMELVHTCHMYEPWHYSCAAVEKAVKAYGGKEELCALEMASVGTARAQFMRIYNAVFTREEERATNEAVLRMLTEKQREMLQRTDNVAKLVVGKVAEKLAMPAELKTAAV